MTAGESEPGWSRLSARMIWVDLAQTVLSALPAIIAVQVVGVDPGGGGLWPLVALAVFGIAGAVQDAVRWVVTRYRVTDTHVELRTGVLLRAHRSIQRDRIRSVDIEARLRHRLAGLRVVKVGAGQQSVAGESALAIDAVSVAGAQGLRRLLLSEVVEPSDAPAEAEVPAQHPDELEPLAVFARFEPTWVVYNMFTIWGYALAAGLAWGTLWLLDSFGVDATGIAEGLVDWEALGLIATVLIAFAALSVVAVAGMAAVYFTEYWGFELARVRGAEGTSLRTRQGLFTTREVNRDEARIRGAQIREPLLWRWLGVGETEVITTGLSLRSMSQPSVILPRAPVGVSRSVADSVLQVEADPFATTLAPHPRAALRRRLVWAGWVVIAVAGGLFWLAAIDQVAAGAPWAAVVLGPALAVPAARISYEALGHAVRGPYLITRSGLFSRATTVLQRKAVSTIVIRESLFQRRLGLRTVSTMTAAGSGGYDTPDVDAAEALAFARLCAPGLLEPFLVVGPESGAARGTSAG